MTQFDHQPGYGPRDTNDTHASPARIANVVGPHTPNATEGYSVDPGPNTLLKGKVLTPNPKRTTPTPRLSEWRLPFGVNTLPYSLSEFPFTTRSSLLESDQF